MNDRKLDLLEDAIIALMCAATGVGEECKALARQRLLSRLHLDRAARATESPGVGPATADDDQSSPPTADMLEAGYKVYLGSCINDYPSEGDKMLLEEIYMAMQQARGTSAANSR